MAVAAVGGPLLARTRARVTRNISGAEYVNAIAARGSDRDARSAFQKLVLRLMPQGGRLFDFGAGPGIDARMYCEYGFHVAAYDVDPAMGEFCAQHCRDLIESGRLLLRCGEYAQFLAGGADSIGGRVQIITSNFAPLCLIEELRPLFAKFHILSAPHGLVLASVLNPYFLGDMRYGWWWRNMFRLCRAGHYSVPGAQAPIVRRSLTEFAELCSPHFRLEAVYRGLPPRNAAELGGVDMRRGAHRAWRRLTGSRFIFLLFRHCDAAVTNSA
jgi:SAM-dependent methyltransferase